MKIKHLTAKKGKVFRNKISNLLYKDVIIFENEIDNWEEVDVKEDDLFSKCFSNIR